MPRIFISYRRTDTQQAAGRLSRALAGHFGQSQIFRDIDSMTPGRDWLEQIHQELSDDTIVLALLGSKWVTETENGQRIIDIADKANRVELETALAQNLTIVPLLVDEARMPLPDELPETLRQLTNLHALRLRDGDWDADVGKIIGTLEQSGVAPASPAVRVRQWLARPMVLLIVAVVAIAAIAIALLRNEGETAAPPPAATAAPPSLPINEAAVNVQIVFDRSDVMKEPFGTGTKLDEARKAVSDVLKGLAENDNFAWREFGGECNDAANQFSLPFAAGKARLEQRLQAVTTTFGKPALVSGVIEATGSFSQVRHSRPNGSRIVVITGGYGECDSLDSADRIQARMKSYPDIALDLRFIGVGLAPPAQSRLTALAEGTKGTFMNAADPAQLARILERVLIIETRVADVEKVITTLNQIGVQLNSVVAHISKPDYDAAERELSVAADAFGRAVVPLPNLRQPPGVRQLIDVARDSRDEQQKMLDAAKALIAVSRSNDAEGTAKARVDYNTASDAYRKHGLLVDDLQTRLLAGVP